MSYHRALGIAGLQQAASERGMGVTTVNYPMMAVLTSSAVRPRIRYTVGQYESDNQQLGESGDGLGGILAVL